MRRFRGRPRHGIARKESKTVSLEPDVIERLEQLGRGANGRDCLSAGITIAEHMTRGLPGLSIDQVRTARRIALTKPDTARTWIVFELVEGPADPPEVPAGGLQLDAWSDGKLL